MSPLRRAGRAGAVLTVHRRVSLLPTCGVVPVAMALRRHLAIAASAAILVALMVPARADDAAGEGIGRRPISSGMRLYRDPDSGAVGVAPPLAATTDAPERIGRADASMREEPVSEPAGGVKVNLQGRFRAAVVRHADRPGVHECMPEGRAP